MEKNLGQSAEAKVLLEAHGGSMEKRKSWFRWRVPRWC